MMCSRFHTAATESQSEIQRLIGFMPVVNKSPSDSLNDVAHLWENVAASSRPRTEKPANASAVSGRMARDTETQRQASSIISTQRKELVNVAQLRKMSKAEKGMFRFKKPVKMDWTMKSKGRQRRVHGIERCLIVAWAGGWSTGEAGCK